MSNPVGALAVYGKTTTGSNAAVGVTGVVNATGTLTLSGNAVAAETVTIGGTVYTFIATLTTTGNQVKIAGSASDTIDNLIAAINKATGDGVQYSYNTAKNLFVTAAAGAGDTMVVTAIQAGADGNGIATTETMSAGSWGAVTLTGGVSGKLLVSVDATITADTAATATAAAPAYVEGTVNPLSVDLSGNLRVVSGAWVRHSANVSAGTQAIPAGAIYQYSIITGTGGDGTMTGLPAGYSDSSPVPITTGFTLTADAASTAKVVWFTRS